MDTSNQRLIPIQEAMTWIAKMAAKDGVITTLERKLLKEFADEYQLDANHLLRRTYALINENEREVQLINSNEIKGRRFEEFVVSLLDDKQRYKLLAWRSDKISGNIYAEENLYPDLHIRHFINDREVEYYIECKYRSSWGDEGIDLSSQFLRYHKYAKKANVELFIALGVGGTASTPEEFLIIPARMIDYSKSIERNRFQPCHCDQTPDAFHHYISNYYIKRVFI